MPGYGRRLRWVAGQTMATFGVDALLNSGKHAHNRTRACPSEATKWVTRPLVCGPDFRAGWLLVVAPVGWSAWQTDPKTLPFGFGLHAFGQIAGRSSIPSP